MATIEITNPTTTTTVDTDVGRGVVKVRQNWTDDWQLVPYLEVKGTTHYRAAPAKSEATLLWRYGNTKRADTTAFSQVKPQDLAGWYVRIDAVNSKGEIPRWYGVIDDDALAVGGGTSYPTGDQTIQCFGLEHLLDRYSVRQVKYEGANAIERIPTFNKKHKRGGYGVIGNRSNAVGSDSVYEFSDDGAVWSNALIIKALLEWNLPTDAPPFFLAGQHDILNNIELVHDFESGTSLREVLNKLVDRRRGLGWCVRVDNQDRVNIHVYSILDQKVSVGSTVVDENKEQGSVTVDGDRKISECVIQIAQSGKYDRVIARGALMKCIFTVAFADGNLEAGWVAALLTAYKNGCKGEANYDSLSDTRTKAEWNDQFRGADRFDRLGTFRVPAGWDRKSANGAGGTKNVAVPKVLDDGTIDTSTAATLWMFDRALLRHLPAMEVGKDYSTDPATSSELDSDAEPELRRPFAIIKDGSRYTYMDKLAERVDQALPNASVRVLDREMAIQVDMRPRHLLFKNDWSGAEASWFGGAQFSASDVLDYNNLLCTVAIEADQHIRMRASGSVAAGQGRELIIDVPDAECIWLAPNTVIDVAKDGSLVRAPTAGMFVADDRDRLEVVAALAWAWYHKARASVKITKKTLMPVAPVGSLLKSVQSTTDARDVGTVVTDEAIDWSARKVTISTNWEGVSFGDFGPGQPTRHSVGRAIQSQAAQIQELNERTHTIPTRIGGSLISSAKQSPFTTLNVLDSANPNTVTKVTSGTGQSTSNARASPGNVKKLALKLRRPMRNNGRSQLIELCLGPNASALQADVDLSVVIPTFSGSALFTRAKVKVSWITNDYDVDAVTWNNYGTALTTSLYGTLQPLEARMLNVVLLTGTSTFKLRSTFPVAAVPKINFRTTLPTVLYGLLLEAEIDHSTDAGVTPTNPSAVLEAEVDPTNETNRGYIAALEYP